MGTIEAFGHQDTRLSPENSTHTRKAESLQHQAAKEFFRALNRATKAAASGKSELAVDWCHYAGTATWLVNPGFFYCHQMEQLLAEIGRRHLRSAPGPSPSVNPPRRFLHLMTGAYERGGHTRVVSRWIETCAQHAPSEHHSILISTQKNDPLPAWLGRSAQKTGGELIVFSPEMSWLQKAAEIRLRSFEFDVVILHIHPNDPLPNIAFYDRPKPILFFRHADHLFNLGVDVAQVVADFRLVGREMSLHFCSPTPRKVMLPLPIFDEGYVSGGKAAARQELGLPADAPIALTIGESDKFIPMHGYSYSAVVQSLCAENPRLIVVAVGPSESEPFPGLGQLVGGRFKAVGAVNDRDLLELYYRAADVYMDAYPFGSSTAVLDAARHGLPVQRLCVPDRCLMWSDDPALDSVLRADTNQDAYIARVLEWLDWPEERRSELGGRFRDAVLRDHVGASWKSNWLDPAIKALGASVEEGLNAERDDDNNRESDFPGLGKLTVQADWFDGMLIAGVILSVVDISRAIRISAVLHSIRPLVFNTTGDGTIRMRVLMFRALISSCLPMRIRMPIRRLRHAIFKNL